MSGWKHDAGDCNPRDCAHCAEDSRNARPPTRDEVANLRAILRSTPRPSTRPVKPMTNAESAAIARKRLDEQEATR